MARQHHETLQGEAAAWKAKLQSHTDKVASNLRSISAKRTRNDKAADILSLQKAGTAHHVSADLLSRHVHQDQLGSTKVELGSLLAAVQGSLADLRIEVAAAKRLSSNASTIMTMSPARKQATPKKTPNNMVSAEQPMPTHSHAPAGGHQHHAVDQVQPILRHNEVHSLHTRSPSPLHHRNARGVDSNNTSGIPYDRGTTEPVSPHAFQQNLVIPAFYPGHATSTGLLAHDPGLPTADNIIKVLDSRINEFASRLEKKIEHSLGAHVKAQGVPSNRTSTGDTNTAARDTNESLLLMSINRAEAAERSTMQLSQHMVAMEKSHNNAIAEWERRVNELSESHRQQLDNLGYVDKALDRINKQQAEQVIDFVSAKQLQALESRLMSAESANARLMSEMEEQQKLLLALSSAVQKAGIARTSSIPAETSFVDDATFKRLEARMSDMESRMSNMNTTLLSNKTNEMSRDMKLDGVDGQQVAAMQAQLEVLEQQLEEQRLSMALKANAKEVADAATEKEAIVTRLSAAEGLVFELAKYVESSARPNIEQTTAAVGTLSTQFCELQKQQSELASKLKSLDDDSQACKASQQDTTDVLDMKDQLSIIQRDLQAMQHASDTIWERLHHNMKEEVSIATEDACNAAVQPIATHLDEVLQRVQAMHDTIQKSTQSDTSTSADVRQHAQHLSELDKQYHDMQQQVQSVGDLISDIKQREAQQGQRTDSNHDTLNRAASEGHQQCTDRDAAIPEYDHVAKEVVKLQQSVTAMHARLTADWFVSLESDQLEADKPLMASVRDAQIALQTLQSTVNQTHEHLQAEMTSISSHMQSLQDTQADSHKDLCKQQDVLGDRLDQLSQQFAVLQGKQQATETSLVDSKQAEILMAQQLSNSNDLRDQLSQMDTQLQAIQARQNDFMVHADVAGQVEAAKQQLLDHWNEVQQKLSNLAKLLEVVQRTRAEDTSRLDTVFTVQQTIAKDVQALQESTHQHGQKLADNLLTLKTLEESTKLAVEMVQHVQHPQSTLHNEAALSESTVSLSKAEMVLQREQPHRLLQGTSESRMHDIKTVVATNGKEVISKSVCSIEPHPAADNRGSTAQNGLAQTFVQPALEQGTAMSWVLSTDSAGAGSHHSSQVQSALQSIDAPACSARTGDHDVDAATRQYQQPMDSTHIHPPPIANIPRSPASPDVYGSNIGGEQSFLSEPDEHEVYGVQPASSPSGLCGISNSSSVWDHVMNVPHDDEDDDEQHYKDGDKVIAADKPLTTMNSWDGLDKQAEGIKAFPENSTQPISCVSELSQSSTKLGGQPQPRVMKSIPQTANASTGGMITQAGCNTEVLQHQLQSQSIPVATMHPSGGSVQSGTSQPTKTTDSVTSALPQALDVKPSPQARLNDGGCESRTVKQLSVNESFDSVESTPEPAPRNATAAAIDTKPVQPQSSQVESTGTAVSLHVPSSHGATNQVNAVVGAGVTAAAVPTLHRQHSLDALGASAELEECDSTSDLRRANSIGGVSVSSDRQRFRRFSYVSAAGSQCILQTHISGGGRNRQTDDSIELEVVDDELGDFLVDDDELIFEQHFNHGDGSKADPNNDGNQMHKSTEDQPSAGDSSNLSSSGWLHISSEAGKLAAGLLSGSREISLSQAGHQHSSQPGSHMVPAEIPPEGQTSTHDVQSPSIAHDPGSKQMDAGTTGSVAVHNTHGLKDNQQVTQPPQLQQRIEMVITGNQLHTQDKHLDAQKTTSQPAPLPRTVLPNKQALADEQPCGNQPLNPLLGTSQPGGNQVIVSGGKAINPAAGTIVENSVALQSHGNKDHGNSQVQGSLMYQESFDDDDSNDSDVLHANNHDTGEGLLEQNNPTRHTDLVGLSTTFNTDFSDDEIEVFAKPSPKHEATVAEPTTSCHQPAAVHSMQVQPSDSSETPVPVEQHCISHMADEVKPAEQQRMPPAVISHIGGRAGLGDESMSLDPETEEEDIVFSDEDGDELPMFATVDPMSSTTSGKLPSQPHTSTTPPVSMAKVSGQQGHGVVLDEDVEDDPVTSGLGLGINTLTSVASTGLQSRPSLTSTTPKAGKPPLHPQLAQQPSLQQLQTAAAPTAQAVQPQGSSTGAALTAASLGLLDSIHTPPLRRSASDLSLPDSNGYVPSSMVRTAGRRRAGRKVPTKGGDDGTASQPDLTRCSMDSWDEGSEYSMEGSLASLTGVAPGGVRPAATMQTRLQFLGTSRKRVSFSEYSEEWDLPLSPQGPGIAVNEDDAGSVDTIDEEQLHDFQVDGADKAELSYDKVIPAGASPQDSPQTGTTSDPHGRCNNRNAAKPSNTGQQGTAKLAHPMDNSQAASSSQGVGHVVISQGGGPQAAVNSVMSPTKVFDDVPLGRRVRLGMHTGRVSDAMAFKIKIFTADRLTAGLGHTDVHMEVLGPSWVISQALPKEKGAFQRGCVDRFAAMIPQGDSSDILAIKLWHEGPNNMTVIGRGRWCLARVEIENKLRGIRYVFTNSDRDGWLSKGRRHAVVMKPTIERIDEIEDLRVIEQEMNSQLQANTQLNSNERQSIVSRLAKVGQMIAQLAGASH